MKKLIIKWLFGPYYNGLTYHDLKMCYDNLLLNHSLIEEKIQSAEDTAMLIRGLDYSNDEIMKSRQKGHEQGFSIVYKIKELL